MSISFKDSSAKYEVCFVQTGSSSEEATQPLKLAFEAMETNQLEPMWLTREECMHICQKEPKLFVMDPLHDEVFDHLKTLQCRIVGPLCILYCLQYGDVLPKRPYPVYSVSMRKITVSCSNIVNDVREDMKQKIVLMGGFFSKDLTKSVTHLVVGEVGSKKYQVAANFGLPIMVPEWISDVWENGQYQQLHATDSCYDKYKCPAFKGLVITVSQISAQERLSIKSIIENNGGCYSGALKSQVTTHLVLCEPTGDKYRFAKSWKISCVKVNWIYDSIEAGYCRDISLYALDDTLQQPKRSTPKKDSASELPLVDCSAIVNNSIVTHLDESVRADISVPSNLKKDSECSTLDSFNLSTLQKGGQYLDGCKIFLTGFSDEHMKKLRKIINAGGGVQFSNCAESVSHIVSKDLSEQLINTLKSFTIKPYVVSFNWLLECCSKGKVVDEKPFLYVDITFSQENELNQKQDQESVVLLNTDSKPEENSIKKDGHISQQSKKNDSEINVEHAKHEIKPQEDENKKSQLVERVNDAEEDVEDEEVTNTEELFKGLNFVVVGFLEKDTEILSSLIETHSGTVLDISNRSGYDVAVVPVVWQQSNLSVSQIVTNCWLQKCIEECRVFDFDENELFRPFIIPSEAKPFDSFVISVSQYSGTERDCLMQLAEILGATCQEYFVRKSNKTKGVLANTHLVVASPEGSKYEASKKWQIPAVTKHWVIDAAKTGSLPKIENYLVDAPNLDASTHNDMKHKSISSIKNEIEVNKNDQHFVVEKNNEPLLQYDLNSKLLDQNKLEPTILTLPARDAVDNSLNSTLNSTAPYNYKFQVSGLLKDLDCSNSNDNSSFAKRQSLPVEEMFSRNLASALKHVNSKSDTPKGCENTEVSIANEVASKKNVKKVLQGVVLCVARKLCYLQSEINDIVASLGGDYLWCYDNTCTHFVFSGKPNDTTKEFREAKSQGKIIVSPEWVYTCQKENEHVEENLFPHTFKSELTLKDQLSFLKTPTSNKKINKGAEIIERKIESPSQTTPVDFNKQLNELLVAAKSAKKRQTRRMANSVSSSPVSEISPMQKYPRHLSDVFLKHDEVCPEEQDTCSQLSQSYPITWDDPTGRLEREKIAARASNNGQAKDINAVRQESIVLADIKMSHFSLNLTPAIDRENASDFKEQSEINAKAKKRKFMFSNISESDKNNFTRIINKLGGDVSDIKTFDVSATHLVVAVPIKNEKFMSSVAAGKWIIHPDYFDACEEQNYFLDESEFEWGGPSSEKFLKNLPPNSVKIAFCPAKWRTKLTKDGVRKGAFQEWKVAIFAEDKAKLLTYTKVLEAGLAEVFSTDNIESCLNRLTHVIVELKKSKSLKLDLSNLVSRNIKCVLPEYLASFLTEDPPSNIENFLIPEVKELLDFSEGPPKRRNLSSVSKRSKRSKLK